MKLVRGDLHSQSMYTGLSQMYKLIAVNISNYYYFFYFFFAELRSNLILSDEHNKCEALCNYNQYLEHN
jgi:hypothetical protein